MNLATWISILWAFIVIQRLTELRVARRNEVKVRAMGAREFGAEHYGYIVALHVVWLVAWPLEAFYLGGSPTTLLQQSCLGLALLTQGLRYWTLSSLGVYWNTRILVVPGAQLVRRGPYRWLSHPNYVAVIIEISSIPLIFGARLSAIIFGLLNLFVLLRIRIPAEEAALRSLATPGAEQPPERG